MRPVGLTQPRPLVRPPEQAPGPHPSPRPPLVPTGRRQTFPIIPRFGRQKSLGTRGLVLVLVTERFVGFSYSRWISSYANESCSNEDKHKAQYCSNMCNGTLNSIDSSSAIHAQILLILTVLSTRPPHPPHCAPCPYRMQDAPSPIRSAPFIRRLGRKRPNGDDYPIRLATFIRASSTSEQL